MRDPTRVLVIGATGVFGARLIAGLLQTTTLTIIAAGRNAAKLDALARSAPTRITPHVLDTRTVTTQTLAATHAFAVVDAAGPYQGGDYRLARAAIQAGMHVIDIADARDYLAGFPSLDAEARAAGIVALAGASSTPALSNAVLDALTSGWTCVDDVAIAISPGNRAPRGLSVMQSILSYAGRPVRVFDGGRWTTQPGWGMSLHREMPGLGRRWLSLSETPDLDIVPQRFAVRRSAIFRAGLELRLLHLGLWLASLLVRRSWLRSLLPFARPLRAMASWFEPFGTDRGGMTVEVTGHDADGHPVRGEWALVAEAGDGPYVPTLPALAALRLLTKNALSPGARACAGVLTLQQIEAEFAGRRISARSSLTRPAPSLYARILGPRFTALPEAVQRMHQPGWGLRARGMARVDGPETRPAAIVAAVFRFPRTADSVALTVEITPQAGQERWVRDFAGRRFTSILSTAFPGHLRERFGPFSFELDLLTDRGGVRGMPVRRWWLWRIPLPRLLAPGSRATETVDAAGRFCFDVELRLPLRLGRLVRYRGWLSPAC